MLKNLFICKKPLIFWGFLLFKEPLFCYNMFMVTAQKITSNTSWYLLALVLQKVLSFVYFTILARYLGPATYGQYQLSLNFAIMLSVVSDLGLSVVLIREVAKQQFEEKKLFQQIFSLKIILSLVSALIIIILDLTR